MVIKMYDSGNNLRTLNKVRTEPERETASSLGPRKARRDTRRGTRPKDGEDLRQKWQGPRGSETSRI